MNNLTDITYLKSFLKQSGLKPRHYLGQNFLVDQDVLNRIIEAADLKKSDTVLEVGPGIGTLTSELIKRAGKVIAVEKDESMARIFEKEYGIWIQIPNSKFQLVNQDILRFHLDRHIQGPYKVVANIPYYLTSVLFQYFLGQENKPELLVLMVQKEVAERVVASPGELSVLGISVQFYADPEIVGIVNKESFWPQPKVDSAILKITPVNKFPEVEDEKLFFRIVKSAFAGKRKQLKNTIRDVEALRRAGVEPTARPQDLQIEDWVRLYKIMKR
ncbi:MAG: ribosomal RNA small subunit methyltransferase A [Candidatus Doudnabacteria bacterium]|nr:ribosomal RNA small subunit methyltransferase A [Candidatus Doudnabacteria bacterium]